MAKSAVTAPCVVGPSNGGLKNYLGKADTLLPSVTGPLHDLEGRTPLVLQVSAHLGSPIDDTAATGVIAYGCLSQQLDYSGLHRLRCWCWLECPIRTRLERILSRQPAFQLPRSKGGAPRWGRLTVGCLTWQR